MMTDVMSSVLWLSMGYLSIGYLVLLFRFVFCFFFFFNDSLKNFLKKVEEILLSPVHRRPELLS